MMSNNKKTIFYVYGIIALSLITANVPAFGQKRLEDTIFLRKPEDKYKLRNAEIVPWVEDGTPQNQGNAALLYYQAFLLMDIVPPEFISKEIHGVTFSAVLDEVAFSDVLDKKVRRYLGSCLDVIEIIEIASRMEQCTWGVWVEPVSKPSHGALRRRSYYLYNILFLDARTLAVDGHYRVALERCLTALRIARHFREDPELYTFTTPLERYTFRIIRYVLGVIPPDAEILTWFRGQLALVQVQRLSYAEILQARFRRFINHMRTIPNSLRYYKNLAIKEAEDEQAKENIRNLTDEQFLTRASEGYARFLDSYFQVLDSEMAYEQKLVRMKELYDEKITDDNTEPVVKSVLTMFPGSEGYMSLVTHQVYINGTKAAVEVYINVAKTGQLPKILPGGLPKDPSTGKDFIYEIMDDGFALRCQDEEFLSSLNRELEFKVKK